MPITDAVIPVAGLGTRLLPATRAQPKELLPILDKPAVQHVVEELQAAGLTRVLFVTGRRKRAIEDHFDAQPELDRGPLIDPGTMQMLYTRQAEPRGLGDALRCAAGFARGNGIVLALADAMIETPPAARPGIVPRLIEAFEREHADAALAVSDVPAEHVSRYGIVITEGQHVTAVVEKPAPPDTPSRTAVLGRYVFGPRLFDALRQTAPDATTGEVQLADALQHLIDSGGRVIAVPLGPGERRHDIGTLEGYCGTFVHYALRDDRVAETVRAAFEESL